MSQIFESLRMRVENENESSHNKIESWDWEWDENYPWESQFRDRDESLAEVCKAEEVIKFSNCFYSLITIMITVLYEFYISHTCVLILVLPNEFRLRFEINSWYGTKQLKLVQWLGYIPWRCDRYQITTAIFHKSDARHSIKNQFWPF